MNNLKKLWESTKNSMRENEEELVGSFISFLREAAKKYLKEGRKVYFRENQVVHWGEGGFGRLTIEGNEDIFSAFGEHIMEIEFEPMINEKALRGAKEIKLENIEEIRYTMNY